jgi:hypothetical protein
MMSFPNNAKNAGVIAILLMPFQFRFCKMTLTPRVMR